MFIICGYVDFDWTTSNSFYIHVPLETGFKLIETHTKDCWIVDLLVLHAQKSSKLGAISIFCIPPSSKKMFETSKSGNNILRRF